MNTQIVSRGAGSFLLILAVLLSGCASSGSADAVYRADVGMSTAMQSMTIGERIFSQFQYTVARTDEPPNLRMETEWRMRPPFDDERAQGITAAESRLVLMGRQRLETELGSQFAMTLMVENRVQVGADGVWEDTRNSPEFRAYARSISERLEQEFRTIGVRSF